MTEDKKLYKRLVSLIKETTRNPYTGLGKPESLKHELQGYWSRRINDEHRLVYKIEADRLIIIIDFQKLNFQIHHIKHFKIIVLSTIVGSYLSERL